MAMHMPPPSAQETARSIELGHEPSTVSVRGVVWFFIVFFAFGAVVHVIIYVMYHQLVKYVESQNVQRSALTSALQPPPEPRLQPTRLYHETTEPEDLQLMRGRDNLELFQRGWINESGEFRIPESVISQIAASGGAPITTNNAAPTTNPASGGSGAGMPR